LDFPNFLHRNRPFIYNFYPFATALFNDNRTGEGTKEGEREKGKMRLSVTEIVSKMERQREGGKILIFINYHVKRT
jgi:hypothetical protein